MRPAAARAPAHVRSGGFKRRVPSIGPSDAARKTLHAHAAPPHALSSRSLTHPTQHARSAQHLHIHENACNGPTCQRKWDDGYGRAQLVNDASRKSRAGLSKETRPTGGSVFSTLNDESNGRARHLHACTHSPFLYVYMYTCMNIG